MNAHLYGSLGEHLVDRPGEADVMGKTLLEVTHIAKVLEGYEAAVQTYANRTCALGSAARTTAQGGRYGCGSAGAGEGVVRIMHVPARAEYVDRFGMLSGGLLGGGILGTAHPGDEPRAHIPVQGCVSPEATSLGI
jgi:hypothetical protein